MPSQLYETTCNLIRGEAGGVRENFFRFGEKLAGCVKTVCFGSREMGRVRGNGSFRFKAKCTECVENVCFVSRRNGMVREKRCVFCVFFLNFVKTVKLFCKKRVN